MVAAALSECTENVIVMSLMSDTPRRQLSLIDLSNRPAKGTTKNKPAPTSNNTTLHTPVRPPRTRLFTPLTTQQTLAEQLSFLHLPRPFKTAVYAKNSIRRIKNPRPSSARNANASIDASRGRSGSGTLPWTTTVEEDEAVPTCTLSPVPSG